MSMDKDNKDKDNHSDWIRKAREQFPKEETAADYPITKADLITARSTRTRESDPAYSAGTAVGWVAVLFAFASLFVWPVWMGATAVLLGFSAYMQGSRKLGTVSMTVGLIAVIVYLLLIPLYYSIA